MTTSPEKGSKPPARLVKLTSPLARQVAGRRWFPLWAVVHHRGRRSGQAYAVPVAVLVTPTTFVIGLPWGPPTNWAQNVLAAGGCTMRWKGLDHHLTDPELVDREVALRAAAAWQRPVIGRFTYLAFLQLRR
jgi:deazaflavin-dependent oxidoreductase (nitroreductase family)